MMATCVSSTVVWLQVHYLEDVVELTSYQLERDSQYALREDKLLKVQ